MKFLLDTNILLRIADERHPQHAIAAEAVSMLMSDSNLPCVAPQNLYEFWVVCTRSSTENGLNITVAEARQLLGEVRKYAEILDENPKVLTAWEALLMQYDVRGKSAHDARLVAIMSVHGVSTILTFNKQHFARYAKVVVLTPEEAIQNNPHSGGQ